MLEIYKSKDVALTSAKHQSQIESIDKIVEDAWINMYAPTEEEINKVESTLNIPQEFLRYPLDEEERPRIDFDDDTGDVLVIVDIPYPRHENNVIKYETAPLGIIISKKHIITVSLRKVPIIDQFIDNRVKDCILAYRTRFTIQILFAIAKDYLRLLRFMDKTSLSFGEPIIPRLLMFVNRFLTFFVKFFILQDAALPLLDTAPAV